MPGLDDDDAAKTGWALALSGYIPFAGLVALLFLLGAGHPLQGFVADALKVYAAVILSFLGGIRWGLAVARSDEGFSPMILIGSVVPSLIGWFAVFLPSPWVFAVFAAAFAGQGAWDAFAAEREKWPAWFARLRITLTVIVVLAMIAALIAAP